MRCETTPKVGRCWWFIVRTAAVSVKFLIIPVGSEGEHFRVLT